MKNLLRFLSLTLALLNCSAFAGAQGAPSPSNYASSTILSIGAPAGNCPGTNVFDIDSLNKNLYICPVAGQAWVFSGGASSTYNFFGNTTNPLTVLANPTEIIDTTGNFINFTASGLVLENSAGDTITLANANAREAKEEILLADSSGNQISMIPGGGITVVDVGGDHLAIGTTCSPLQCNWGLDNAGNTAFIHNPQSTTEVDIKAAPFAVTTGNSSSTFNCALTSTSPCVGVGESTASTDAGSVGLQVTMLTTSTSIPFQITQGAAGPASANAPAVFSISAAAAGGAATASQNGFVGAPISLLTGAGSAGGATTGQGGAGGAFNLTTGGGGAAGGTGTDLGAAGGDVLFTTGNGGAGGSTTGKGGRGGNFTVTLGSQGSSGSTTNNSGGEFLIQGSTVPSTAATTGDNYGTLFQVSGQAGGANSNNAGTAGSGSAVIINSGFGGAGTGTNTKAGDGGNITFQSGNAGGGSSGGTENNANGGNIAFNLGRPDTSGSGTAGNAGEIVITPANIASSSVGNGGNQTTVFNLSAGAGGATTFAGGTGGSGSGVSMLAGNGGASTGGGANGGVGGSFTFTSGNGGAGGTGSAGQAGDFVFNVGSAGAAGSGTSGRSGEVQMAFGTVGGALTTPFLNITGTWNTTGVVDAAIFENITNTASGAASKLVDLQVGSTSQFAVDKVGNVTTLGTLACGLAGTTSCVITGAGSASGSATLTWPATAGTAANAIVSSNRFQANGYNNNGGKLLIGAAAPTISSGFGTTPSVPNNNGPAAFTVNVGTGGTASTGVIAMGSTATTGWACMVAPNGAPQAAAVTYSAPTSTTTVTLTNYTLSTGVALAWTSGTVLQLECFAY